MSSERNTALCNAYLDGQTIAALAGTFQLSRLRVRQILKKGGVWKRQPARPAFLGVDVTPETKELLKEEADRRQMSMSRLASDAIETMLKGDKE